MNPGLIRTGIVYPDLSYKIIGIAYEIHNKLGPGFTEDLYEKACVYELESSGIPYERQKVIHVGYKGKPLGIYRLDLVIDSKIILELKAVSQLNDLFKQQLRTYLKATGMQLGILINFGASNVEYERIVNTRISSS